MKKHVSKVYCTVTGDTLSKPTYDSKTVISYYQDHLNEVVKDRFDEVIVALEGKWNNADLDGEDGIAEGLTYAIDLIENYR